MPAKPMNIVVPKETFPLEKRVVVTPQTARKFANAGHNVFVQAGAGSGINMLDGNYADAGATIISEPRELYSKAEGGMVMKMKAPTAEEFSFMKNSIVFCMLHIGQNKERIYYMGSQGLKGVAMEDIRDEKSKRQIDQTDITGQMGVYFALRYFQKLPSDMKAVILGYGNVAHGAIKACSRLCMKFKIMRKSELKKLPLWLKEADLLVNAISWPEKQRERKEYLVTREDVKKSNPGMIVLDLAVDFPNPIETIHPTDYLNPSYLDEGRVHISIYGYPGLVPVSSSQIYSEQVLPYALAIADNGGLRGIGKIETIGPHIKRAIVNPEKYGDWNRFRPHVQPGSNIE
ncbi:MAG: hypothetical protein WC506_04600 [Candidatus Micrarchaeia archaeon]